MSKSNQINFSQEIGTSFRTSGTGEIDYNEIMEVIDTTGVANYTFRIKNHPDDNASSFHNLVLSQDGSQQKMTILKYEYQNDATEFKNFVGQVTSRNLSSDVDNPCDPLVVNVNIPIGEFDPESGGNSGAIIPSRPGSGQTNNPPINTTGGGGGNHGLTVSDQPATFQCNSCNFSASSWGLFSNHTDSNGTIYSFTIVLNFRTANNKTTIADPCDPIGSIGVLENNKVVTSFLNSLNSEQTNWWNNTATDQTKNEIIDYLNQNNTSQNDFDDAVEFVKDFIEYLYSNPNTKLIQFQNWFAVTNEGQDFIYSDSYWQNPNLTFQEQDLPSWADFYNAYPRNLDGTYMTGADNVYEYVGGEVYQARLNFPNQTKNTCALKVSIALNDSGINIPNLTDSNGLPITLKGGDDKYYFLNAKHLNNWMKETFGVSPDNPKHKSFASAQEFTDYINTNIANGTPVNGIYFLVKPAGTNISGHADMLFESGLCAAGCNLQLTIDHIDLWILD